jgi:hypothetical protein
VLSWDVGAGTEWLVGLGMAGMVGALVWLGWRRRAGTGRSLEGPLPGRRLDAGQGPARSSLASGDYDPADFAPESSVHLARTPAADASARSTGPWWGVPEGFDADAFLDAAKRNFVVLQQAWDAADLARRPSWPSGATSPTAPTSSRCRPPCWGWKTSAPISWRASSSPA